MEPIENLTHPSDRQLEAFLDPALPAAELERLAEHLDVCAACEARLEKLEPGFSQYRQCLEAVHAQVLGEDRARYERWRGDLWTRMVRLEANRSPRRPVTWRVAWLSGVAAAVAGIAFLLVPWGKDAEARAETLLAKAAVSRGHSQPPSRLRIRTKNASFFRPAVALTGAMEVREEMAIREHFLAANYNWQEPLSVESYSGWRHALTHKTSQVSGTPGPAGTGPGKEGQSQQRIETTTDESTLRDASLTLDASLTPVSGRFQFADQEWVEISLVPDLGPVVAAVLPAPSAVAQATPVQHSPAEPPAEPLAERELKVRLAIDALNAGAGDPVEVKVAAGGTLDVIAYGLSAERNKELAAGLDPIAGVTLHSEAGSAMAKPAAPHQMDRVDRILRASQDVAFESHLLADLAARFDSVAEASLSPESGERLLELRRKHALLLSHGLTGLRHELEAEQSGFHPAAAADSAEGIRIAAMAQSATRVDRLVTMIYAGPYSGKDVEPTQKQRWHELEAEFGKLQSLAQFYEDHLGSSGAKQ